MTERQRDELLVQLLLNHYAILSHLADWTGTKGFEKLTLSRKQTKEMLRRLRPE
jgi:hypothetical protein